MRFGDERSPRSCGAGAEIGSLRQARALRLCTIREQKKSAPRTVHAAPDAYGYCEGLPGQQTFLQGPGRQDASRRGAPRPGLGRPAEAPRYWHAFRFPYCGSGDASRAIAGLETANNKAMLPRVNAIRLTQCRNYGVPGCYFS